jgi:hypothetical protein
MSLPRNVLGWNFFKVIRSEEGPAHASTLTVRDYGKPPPRSFQALLTMTLFCYCSTGQGPQVFVPILQDLPARKVWIQTRLPIKVRMLPFGFAG